MDRTVDILILCTGNAARSVMAGVALETRRPDLSVETGGTLVIDGQPISVRTRTAIQAVGLPLPRHASRQIHPSDLDDARLVIGLAPEHIEWVRRTHPVAAPRSATLKRLVRDLDPDLPSLGAQIDALSLARTDLGDWEEVVDPGGGDTQVFVDCAHEIDALVATLATRLGRRPCDTIEP